MTDNPDAVKHEGLARESAGLRPPEKFAHPAFDPTNPSGTSWALNPWVPMSKPIDLKHLGKLAEELNEAGSAVARCIIQGIDECEPVTLKQNRKWLEDELADVTVNIDLVTGHFGLDREMMQTRAARKRTHLRAWHAMLISEDADKRPLATPPELLTRAKNQWADACIERDAAQEEVVRLRTTLRDTIAALDVAAIALDTAGDKLAASMAAAAIGNVRKGLGDDL